MRIVIDVHEMADHVAAYATPRLSDSQRAEVKRRVANPSPIYATPEKVRAFFARFGIQGA